MFFDWLTMYQDHAQLLPMLGQVYTVVVDAQTGEQLHVRQPTIVHEGSYSTTVHIRVAGNRVTVSGNPSRINRIDNLFGFQSLDQCVAVFNRILLTLGLPPFTKCTQVFHRQSADGKRAESYSDGAIITELHITSNRAVGQGATNDYIKALSTQRYHNSIPRLHTNGQTADWLSQKGKASLIYPSVYCKAYELRLHSLPKIARKYGIGSAEYNELVRVIEYCEHHGVVRFEQKLKAAFLRRSHCRFYGLFDPAQLRPLHAEFLALDQRLQVTVMDLETIADQLLRLGICSSVHAANSTSLYAMQWMSGKTFQISKRQVQTHRARLRKIGIDIAGPCDLTKFSPVVVRSFKTIDVYDLPVPDWYQLPQVQPLRLAA